MINILADFSNPKKRWILSISTLEKQLSDFDLATQNSLGQPHYRYIPWQHEFMPGNYNILSHVLSLSNQQTQTQFGCA